MPLKFAIIQEHTVRAVGLQDGQHLVRKLPARQILSVFLFLGGAAGVHLLQLLKIDLVENAGISGEVAAGPQAPDALPVQDGAALQGLIDRVLLVHKLLVGENLTELVFLKIGIQLRDFLHAVPVDFPAFFAQGFAQGLPHIHRIDQLHLPPAVGALVPGQNKDIDPDIRIIKQLGGQRDNGLDQVLLQHPAPDLALTAGGAAGKERGTVGDNRRASVFLIHLVDGVLQEQQLGVPRTGEAMFKPPALSVLLPYLSPVLPARLCRPRACRTAGS